MRYPITDPKTSYASSPLFTLFPVKLSFFLHQSRFSTKYLSHNSPPFFDLDNLWKKNRLPTNPTQMSEGVGTRKCLRGSGPAESREYTARRIYLVLVLLIPFSTTPPSSVLLLLSYFRFSRCSPAFCYRIFDTPQSPSVDGPGNLENRK